MNEDRLVSCHIASTRFCSAGTEIYGAGQAALGGERDGCGGFGSMGPTVGAGVGCAGSPTQPTSNPQTYPKADTSGTGYTYKPADNDWGYITCPNPTGPNMPDSFQEYGPNGKPIGTPSSSAHPTATTQTWGATSASADAGRGVGSSAALLRPASPSTHPQSASPSYRVGFGLRVVEERSLLRRT